MKDKLISVIMSTYNEPLDWVKKAIDSILNQEKVNLEFIIVCDNPKNDELIKLLLHYKEMDSRINLIFNKTNIGLTKSLNRAIEASKGDFVARMDSDDFAELNRLSVQLDYLVDNELDLVGAAVKCIAEDEKLIRVINNLPKLNNNVKSKIVSNNCLPHPTWFGKKEVFVDLNGYRDVNYAEDYDFLLRALFKGFKLGNVNEILLNYRMRATSISNLNGLKQFVISQVLVDLYKKGVILDLDKVNEAISNSIKHLSVDEETAYMNASKCFMKALESKNPILLSKSIFISKYYRRKLLCYIKGFL